MASAKTSSCYCLTPGSSTTSLHDLNHSLSVNLHLNSSANESVLSNGGKRCKSSSSTSQRTRTSVARAKTQQLNEPSPVPLNYGPPLTAINGEPVKRKRGRPRKSIAPAPTTLDYSTLTMKAANVTEQQSNCLQTVVQQPAVVCFSSTSVKSTSNLQRCKTTAETLSLPTEQSSSPLPQLDWANSDELWQVMKRKEREQYKHDWRYISTHVDIEPRMRAILLDWLVEIAHAYRLHRETFHLAVEYFDRFMTLSKQRVRVDRFVSQSLLRPLHHTFYLLI